MKNIVCIVGAGFLKAMLEKELPITEELIVNTVKSVPNKFPALHYLYREYGNIKLSYLLNLNIIWSNIGYFAGIIKPKINEIMKAYSSDDLSEPTKLLFKKRLIPNFFINNKPLESLLGLELIRMLAFHYNNKNIILKKRISEEFQKLIKSKKKNIVWASLNYDTVLEHVLQEYSKGEWEYVFGDLFIKTNTKNNARNKVLKPHGSLNVKFKTVWGNTIKHSLEIVNPQDWLETCREEAIGMVIEEGESVEVRPSIIGYYHDSMKAEFNSSVSIPDINHDFIKMNACYFSLALQRADSLYILGYSMPSEDLWIWNRIKGMRKTSMSVYVSSGNDSDRIINELKRVGFHKARLFTKGGIL
ncbi:MAG: hypothetical protein ACMUIP_13785 [bacterium]